jgi:tRNA threonylcarbamoyladenosine biosynthesis protein TsaB
VAVVALETSARPASVAVESRGRVLEVVLDPARAHASDLLPALDRLLREAGVPPREVRAVLVGTGPGSYTGLRVGVATALGIARASGAALRGVPSGETVAWAELGEGEVASVLSDARSGELYLAAYARLAAEVEVLLAPRALPPAVARAALLDRGPVFADATSADAAGLTPAQRARVRTGVAPRAGALLALGSRRLVALGPQRPEEVAPLYLRPFAAKARRR